MLLTVNVCTIWTLQLFVGQQKVAVQQTPKVPYLGTWNILKLAVCSALQTPVQWCIHGCTLFLLQRFVIIRFGWIAVRMNIADSRLEC